MNRPPRLTDLVIPDPFQPPIPNYDRLGELIPRFRYSVRRVLQRGVKVGVLNSEDSKGLENRVENLTSSLMDILSRIQKVTQLEEGISREEYYDLRYKWKDGYKRFLKFRDDLRDTKNVLLQGQLISRQVGDEILDQTEEYCRMLDQLDTLVQKTLGTLFQGRSTL